jgi:maleylpyruvate isomerase
MKAERPDPEVLAGGRLAHVELRRTLATVADDAVQAPSLLAGWTRGHVLAHLARNADSHVRVLLAAAAGEAVDRYPGGVAQRNGEIDEGARRTAAELRADVAAGIDRLEAAWDAMPEPAWGVVATSMGRPEPVAGLPFKRWREVELHHRDLGLAFTEDDWSDGYVRRELHHATLAWRARHAMGLTALPAAALALAPRTRLAWLVGRRHIEGLDDVEQWF